MVQFGEHIDLQSYFTFELDGYVCMCCRSINTWNLNPNDECFDRKKGLVLWVDLEKKVMVGSSYI